MDLPRASARAARLAARVKPRILVAFTAASAAVTLTACTPGAAPGSSDAPAASSAQSSAEQPPLDGSSRPPWPAHADVPARVASAGLDLGPMGTADHYHPHLRIVIDGSEVPVPPGIGVDPNTGAMSALHTHEGDGTLHIEADTQGEIFTLGQFFTQWGVKLTARQIGGVHAEPGQLVVTSDGEQVTGDPADLRLEPDQQIVVTVR